MGSVEERIRLTDAYLAASSERETLRAKLADSEERVRKLHGALFLARDWVKAVESSDDCNEATLQAMDIIDDALSHA